MIKRFKQIANIPSCIYNMIKNNKHNSFTLEVALVVIVSFALLYGIYYALNATYPTTNEIYYTVKNYSFNNTTFTGFN